MIMVVNETKFVTFSKCLEMDKINISGLAKGLKNFLEISFDKFFSRIINFNYKFKA